MHFSPIRQIRQRKIPKIIIGLNQSHFRGRISIKLRGKRAWYSFSISSSAPLRSIACSRFGVCCITYRRLSYRRPTTIKESSRRFKDSRERWISALLPRLVVDRQTNQLNSSALHINRAALAEKVIETETCRSFLCRFNQQWRHNKNEEKKRPAHTKDLSLHIERCLSYAVPVTSR